MNTVLIIPALDPPDMFVEYVKELKAAGFEDIIVVDDGSVDKGIFERIGELGAVILTHEANKGKGAALKYAFSYYFENYDTKKYHGVITLDSDGQHLIKDVERIDSLMSDSESRLLLGSRDFSKDNVPPKSKFGNTLTHRIFKLFFRLDINDTQTGLRGIPNGIIRDCITLTGDRFEYETRMLLNLAKKVGVLEVPIETVYHDDNSGTHFNPIVDSIKIYGVIFGTFISYTIVSLSSFLVDIILFALLDKLILIGFANRIVLATVAARVVSSLYNFLCNRNIVFNSKGSVLASAAKYIMLCLCIMMASAGFVTLFDKMLHIDTVIIKVFVDTALFVVSYTVQKKFVF